MATLIGIASIVCLLIGCIALLNLIQKVFEREGVLWGSISVLYPVGTYLYCRKNWALYRRQFILINILIISSLVLFLILKLFTSGG